MINTKRCTKCKEPKPLDSFSIDRDSSDGRAYRCRDCQKEDRETPERREYMRLYVEQEVNKERETNRKHDPEYLKGQRRSKKEAYQIPEVRETLIKRSKTYAKENPKKILVSSAKHRSARLGVPFSLVSSDILIPCLCPVLGVRLERSPEGFSESAPSLDRIVPELGYTKENIVVISKRANRLRNNGSAEQHVRIADWMEEFREGKRDPRRDHKINEMERDMVYQARIRARKTGILCQIQPEDAIIPECCPVFDTCFQSGSRQSHPNSPSLDRVDPTQGYIKGNVAVISWRANQLKSDGTVEEHRKIAAYIQQIEKAA